VAKPSTLLSNKNGNGSGSKAAPQPRIYWAVLFDRMTHWRAVRSIIRVSMVCGAANYVNLSVDQKRTDITRDELIAEFRSRAASPDDALVMLDNDHEFPNPEIVGWLGNSEFDVTAALAFRRGSPFDPIMFLRCADGKLHPIAQWEPGTVIQCHMVGHGAIAIKRRVFDSLEKKGFSAPFYRYTYPEGSTARPSEDMYFGSTCEQAEIGMFCDTRLVIPHLIDDAIDEKRWQHWLDTHPGNVVNSNDYSGETPQLKVSIILPTHGRKEQAVKCLDQLFETVQGRDVEVIVVSDDTLIEDSRVKMIVTDNTHGAIANWNAGLAHATGDAIVLGADDLWFHEGWLEAALRGLLGMPEHSGMVGLNDMATDGTRFATHYLMTRDYIERFNGGVLAIPKYQHNFIDVEATARAMKAGRYHYAEDSLVEHRHYLWGKAEKDATYQRTAGTFKPDQETFLQREAAGFPNDFEPVLGRVTA
jgi:hypothetical protein